MNTKSPLDSGRGFFQTTTTMEKTTATRVRPARISDMKARLGDLLMAVNWRDFANRYFQHSSSWLYHKLDGVDGNGGIQGSGGFTPQETAHFRGALYDLAERLRRAADELQPGEGVL